MAAVAVAAVEEDVMVLIGMVTVQGGDVAGILVVGEGIDIVATVLAHMTAADEMAPQNYAEELEERKN
ncbi:hypothetical protein C3L33_21176, partial [Rhododendron williamsianum]